MALNLYAVIVTVNDDNGIVNVTSHAAHLPGKTLSFETAWCPDSLHDCHPEGCVARDPSDGHEIMTYDDKDQAIGEAMTSLRDSIDCDDRYR